MRPKMRIWKRAALLLAGLILPACASYSYAPKARAVGDEWTSLRARGRLVPSSPDPIKRARFYDEAAQFEKDIDELARGGVAPASTSTTAPAGK